MHLMLCGRREGAMRILGVLVAVGLAAGSPAGAENFTAVLYAQGSPHDQPLFTQAQTEQHTGDTLTSVRRVYATPQEQEAAVEEVTFEGGRVQAYRLEQKQTGDQGRMEVSGGRLLFTYTAAGKTSTDSELAPPDLVVAPTVVPYLRARWDTLLQGQTIKVRLAVLERKETVGFQFTKIGEPTVGGKPVLVVQMKPSSFIIAALVKSIRMTFDKESRRLIDYSGRTVPLRQVDGKWEPLDVEIEYRY
jgi:hypothetical protein